MLIDVYVDECKNYLVDNETRMEVVAAAREITSRRCSNTSGVVERTRVLRAKT